jgi:hypothetical protein
LLLQRLEVPGDTFQFPDQPCLSDSVRSMERTNVLFQYIPPEFFPDIFLGNGCAERFGEHFDPGC